MLVVPRKRPAAVSGLARHTARSALTGTLRQGPDRQRFEDAVAARLDGASVAAVGSGRLALLLVLESLGIRPPATIVLAAYNASCVPNVLQAAGFRPWFVDVREDTLHLDADALPAAPPPGAEALIITHIEGSPAPVGTLAAWARRHGLAVVEDAAHALGARLDGRPVGSLGDGAIFSLGRGKHLNTLGGGLAVVRAPDAAERLSALADALPAPGAGALLKQVLLEGVIETGTAPALFGALAMPAMRLARRFGRDPMTALFEDDKSALAAIPEPMRRRLSNLQAGFGLAALPAFAEALRRRREHADALRARLGGVLSLQTPVAGAEPAWLELTALVDDRDGFQAALLARGVDTQRTWMDACDALPAFAGAASPPCPTARRVAERAVYLPTYAALTDAQREAMADVVLDVALATSPRVARRRGAA
ncbi:MAG: DegT/DnrJ/EryC1/StrS family aminotransferase [Deltaproteobacteria bacterium]|nr:DegT/DnrJ/EryC1/StrS family aminotransferase [Deltaproteobacteria bacterium]